MGEGADVSKHGRDGDDRDAAGVGCYRNFVLGGTRWVGMLAQASVPERSFDAPDRDLGHRDDPSADRRDRPGQPQRGRERLLGRLLSKVEMADVVRHFDQHASPLLAKDSLDQRAPSMPWRCTNGRTSTTPPSRAAGQRAAISSTGSRPSASKR